MIAPFIDGNFDDRLCRAVLRSRVPFIEKLALERRKKNSRKIFETPIASNVCRFFPRVFCVSRVEKNFFPSELRNFSPIFCALAVVLSRWFFLYFCRVLFFSFGPCAFRISDVQNVDRNSFSCSFMRRACLGQRVSIGEDKTKAGCGGN